MMPAERLRRTGVEAGSGPPSAAHEPGSGLLSLQNTALSLVHREGEAATGDLLRFASPQASARKKNKTSNTAPILTPHSALSGEGGLRRMGEKRRNAPNLARLNRASV